MMNQAMVAAHVKQALWNYCKQPEEGITRFIIINKMVKMII